MTRAIEVRIPTAEGMRFFGEAIAQVMAPGDVVVLAGDLGAGKTTLVQGAARGLGVEDRVTSPTFTLVRQYRGRWPVRHADMYRLERIQEVIDLADDELFEPDGITFVEWGDVVEGLLPDNILRLELLVRAEDEGRMGILSATGTRWVSRWERLEAAVDRWVPRAEA